MKRIVLFAIAFLLLSTFIYLNSCKKTESNDIHYKGLIEKVNSWLDSQKSPTQPNKGKNIDLLKENLDFGKLRYEQLNKDDQFLILPIKNPFKTLKNIDSNTIPSLLLTMDKSGNILRGSVVLFTSENGVLNKVPENTFHKIYNHESLDCSGLFKFLSVTGRLLYQYEFKNGEMHSFGAVQPKTPTGVSSSLTTSNLQCWDWYLFLYYWENGVLVNQTSIYLGTTCDDDGTNCDDPMYQTLCPDGGGGGNGNGNPPSSCCIMDPNAQLTSTSISETSSYLCGSASPDATTGLQTKTCTFSWYYTKNTLMWYTWKTISIERSKEQLENGVWKFVTGGTTHVSNTITGDIPDCVNFSSEINSAIPSLSADKLQARMDITFTTTFQISCCPWCSPKHSFSNGGNFWYAQ